MHTHNFQAKVIHPKSPTSLSFYFSFPLIYFHWEFGRSEVSFLLSLIYYLSLFSALETCQGKYKRQKDGLRWPGLWIFILLCALFSPFLIYFCAKHSINALYKAMSALKQALKLMLWFSVEKGEIHVGWSGTSCDFETLESYCDFFSFPPAFL